MNRMPHRGRPDKIVGELAGGRDLSIGVDIGGTFTDCVVVGRGSPVAGKVSSTPDDPARGFFAAIDLVGSQFPGELNP